jgi:sulfatase modifying factor 1
MGTDKPIIPEDGESPARLVTVSSFYLQEKEVSIRQFAEFVLKTNFVTETEKFGWSFAFEKTLSKQVLADIDKKVDSVPWWLPVEHAFWYQPEGWDSFVDNRLDHPVVQVTWNDAKAYCEWLGLRLPREAEYERALRGESVNASFPWGNVLYPDGKYRANLWQGKFPQINTIEDGYEYAAPVDAFGPQNEFGVYNLLGNVWEWVADAWIVNHSKYIQPGVTLVDPLIEIQGRLDDPTLERVKRGGSYMCHESYCYRYRTASRSHNTADSSAQNLGIRCAGDVIDESSDEAVV